MVRRALFILVVLVMALGMVLGCAQEPAPTPSPSPSPTPSPAPTPQAEPVTLDFVSFTPPMSYLEYGIMEENFINPVNEKAGGKVVINYRGGPEVIPSFDLGVSVQKNTIQMTAAPMGFWESLVPGIDCTRLTQLSVEEEAANGAFDYLQELCAAKGLYYMGRADPTELPFFYLFSNKKISKISDFAGTKISGSPSFHGFYQALKATPVVIPLSEYYTAMERGTVDIGSSSIYVWNDGGSYEVTKYMIKPGFYIGTPGMIVNLDVWNKIPADMQQLMTEQFAIHQKAWLAIDNEERPKAETFIQEQGVEIIDLAPDVAEEYIRLAYDGGWEFDMKRYPEDIVTKLRSLLSK